MRESNPRPLPPEGRIIPLDQRPKYHWMVASSEDRTRDLLLTRQMLCQLSYRGECGATASLGQWTACLGPSYQRNLRKEKAKSMCRYGCRSEGLGTSDPSLAAAEGFPCSVAGLMAVPLSLVSHDTRTYVQMPLANRSLERERPSTVRAVALSDQHILNGIALGMPSYRPKPRA